MKFAWQKGWKWDAGCPAHGPRVTHRARRSRVDGVKRCVCERFVFWRGILGHFAGKCLETFLLCLDIDAPKMQANVAPNIGDKCVQGNPFPPPRPVHVRVILPRCTKKEARRGLVLVVRHKLALGLLGCGPGARALVLTLGCTEMSTACHRSPVFCLPRSFISASFVVGCMANFSEISPHFFPHGKFQ